jgi:lipoprotein-anchoring transpeptidase ErfK/SrfK
MKKLSWIGELAVRICFGGALVAATILGSLGQAVAQPYYYPRDYYGYYYGPPPPYYPPPLRGYYGRPPSADYYGPPPEGYYPPPRRSDVYPAAPPGEFGAPWSGPTPSAYPRPYYAQPARAAGGWIAGLPPEDQPEANQTAELPPQFRRQLVPYVTTGPAGTIVIDTPHTFLYLVLGDGKAMRYGIGVGREGFTWSGIERISRMSKWPDWHPPKEMIERQPYLPRFTAGGEGNPLGARALYLGNTIYRIHGTNQPSTIGHFVSSGCIRLTNQDVLDLYNRVSVGTRVVVLPGSSSVSASAQSRVAR